MSDTTPPRNVIYFSSDANQIPLAGIGTLPYTDVIVGFLVPDANLNLHGTGGAFNGDLQTNIQTLQNAGKNVLISVGGGAGFPSSAYQSYAQNVSGLANQIVNFVTNFGFNGVDIDYEDSSGFTGSYDGVGFLTTLTSALAGARHRGKTSSPMPHRHPIGIQDGITLHTPRYGNKWVIRSHGSTTNSTTILRGMRRLISRSSGIRMLPPLRVHRN